ncbi:MAG: VWA domain-containing protein, partial [Deltaproteobacteria bacterium]
MRTAGNPRGKGSARERRVAPLPLLLLWVVSIASSCTDADVFRVYEPPPLPQDRITIQGSYCASEPEDLVFPVKILFIFDDSGSMAESDPNFRRLSAALELVDLLLQEKEVYFGVEHFQNAQPMLLTQDPVFTRDRAALAQALDSSLHQPAGGTPYVGALSTAITAIKGDINADPLMAARTRYVVIFLSDGEPTDDKAPPYPQIMDRVHQLKQLEQGYPAAGEVTLHTAYLESNGDDSGGSHVALLQQMAEETGGQFRNFESGEAIDFTQFDVTAISRDFMAVFPLLVTNLNARPSLTGPVADSDGDGLTDEEEDAMGTDSTNPDTDGDGCSDMMEVAYAGWDPLTPGWETSPQHCECKDELRHADTDGDGLTDCEEVWLSLDRKQPDSDYDVEGRPQPDNMLDSLEVWYHLGRTRADGADDYDRDGVGNLDELVQHMDPNVSDNAMREEIGYRFEYLYQQQQRPNCYDFRVSNVPVVSTRATPGHAAGVNRILLYFIEAPQDDPHRERVVRAALLQVQFDGWAVEPELLEVRPED